MKDKPGFIKQTFQGIGFALIFVGIFFSGTYFFYSRVPEVPVESKESLIGSMVLPDGIALSKNKSLKLSESKVVIPELTDGSKSEKKNHPVIAKEEFLNRDIKFPKDIKGKWKSVKLLIKDKKNFKKNKIKLVKLGSSFDLGEGFLVTVGPFFPNFVMNELYYTSMNNQLLNPAVHLQIKKNGEPFYDGWAFARYPDLYAFKHPRFGIQLIDYFSAEVL